MNFVKAMGASRLLMIGVVFIGLLAFFWMILSQTGQDNMKLLYTELDPAEAREIAKQLNVQGVNFKIENNGSDIMVPADKVNQLRATLADVGMGGHVVGWEIFDQEKGIGSTNAEHLIRVKRATQGELQRAITEISGVSRARVLINMPEGSPLSRKKQIPSASVTVVGRGIGPSVASSIQRLVANAVPGLSTDRVAVINSATGQVLASGDGTDVGQTNSVDDKRVAIQQDLRNRIESLIGSSVGPENVRATVFVELTRDQKTITSNVIDPDSGVEVARESSEETSDEPITTGGVVSADNNVANAAGAGGPTASSSSSRTNEVINTEYTRSHTQEVILPGAILRVSAAVMVNNSEELDEDGNVIYSPPSQAALQQFEQLVKRTIGYKSEWEEIDADGNLVNPVVTITPIAFTKPPKEEEPAETIELLPGVKGEDLKGLVRTAITGLVTILIILLIVRPLVKRLIDAIPDAVQTTEQVALMEQAQAALDSQQAAPLQITSNEIPADVLAAAASGDAQATALIKSAQATGAVLPESIDAKIDVAQVEGRIQDSALKKVGDIIERSPEDSVAIVRSWLYGD